MKQTIAALLAAALLLCCMTGCKSESGETASAGTQKVPTVLSQTEYVLYQNIFFNEQADQYVDKAAVKEGTFVRVEDRFNNVTRYYVWGYYDNTKCCDWQWEFVPKDPASLPANGSLVKMTGTFRYDENALDKYWFTDAELEVKTAYDGPTADVDMCAMSATLERVQLINMQVYKSDFAGKSVRAYGRILQPSMLQHPYYDNAWTQEFKSMLPAPAIGTLVILTGTWEESGKIVNASTVATKDY